VELPTRVAGSAVMAAFSSLIENRIRQRVNCVGSARGYLFVLVFPSACHESTPPRKCEERLETAIVPRLDTTLPMSKLAGGIGVAFEE
jgi:hypothetical protein